MKMVSVLLRHDMNQPDEEDNFAKLCALLEGLRQRGYEVTVESEFLLTLTHAKGIDVLVVFGQGLAETFGRMVASRSTGYLRGVPAIVVTEPTALSGTRTQAYREAKLREHNIGWLEWRYELNEMVVRLSALIESFDNGSQSATQEGK